MAGTENPVEAGVRRNSLLDGRLELWQPRQGYRSAIDPIVLAAAVAAATFVAVVWRTRYVSVGSIVATTSLVPVLYLMGASSSILIGAALTAALILYRHRGNVARLSAGTERRFGQG